MRNFLVMTVFCIIVLVATAANAAPTSIGIYRNGTWYLDANRSWDWNGTPTDILGTFGVGLTGAIPVVGDWNGDGKSEIGVYIDGIWYLDMNGNWQWDGEGVDVKGTFGVGLTGAIPVVGDWNGDGKSKIGVYIDGIWYLDMNGNWQWDEGVDVRGVFGVGLANAVPVTGDWNGDGITEIGIYSNGYWYLDKNRSWDWNGTPTDTFGIFGIGLPNAIPVTGDWNGDGITKIGVYSEGNWYLDTNASWQWDGTPTDTFGLFGVGLGSVTPVTGKWTSALQGTYRHIDQSVGFFTYVDNSTTYAAIMVYGDTAIFNIDGHGNCTVSGSGTNYDMFPATHTLIPTPDTFSNLSCTYTFANNGSAIFNIDGAPYYGWASVDGNIIIRGEASADGTLHQSEQSIEIKTGTSMSNASLNGTYAMVSQSIGFDSYSGGKGTEWASNFYGDNQLIIFNGNGTCSSSGNGTFYEMFHTANVIGQNPEVWSNLPCTYSVSGDGALAMLGAPYGGWVSADGNIFILGGAYVDGVFQASEQDIAVKLGTSMNNASLHGTFKLVMQSAGFFLSSSIAGTVAGSMVHTYGPDTWTFDGLGGCSVTTGGTDTEYDMSHNSIYTNTYPIGGTTACTYSVASNGTIAISIAGFNLTAWLSANGNYFIWGGGGWSNNSLSGGAIPTIDGGPVWTEQAIGVKVQ